MQMHFLIYPLLLHIWYWFMCVRGSYELKMCAFAFKGKIKLCIHLGEAQLHFMNFCELNYIYLANSCVVIKHQKGGDWKSISWVNDILVFVVNTRVINHLFKCEGLLVNDSKSIDPPKVKRSKHWRPRFLVVYFRSPYYQEGLLDEKLGWNQILHSLAPLCNMVARTLQKSCLWGFSKRRLRVSEPETPDCKGWRLWLWAGDSGQRIWPPKLIFHPSGASLCCPSGVFEKTLRRLRGFCTREPETPALTGRRLQVTPETPDSKVGRLRG
jgi:hypothetical protein